MYLVAHIYVKYYLLQIVRVQNPELYIQYLAKKAQMEKQNKGMHSEKTLWHGTANGAIRNINRYGFNRSFCGKNGQWWFNKKKLWLICYCQQCQ